MCTVLSVLSVGCASSLPSVPSVSCVCSRGRGSGTIRTAGWKVFSHCVGEDGDGIGRSSAEACTCMGRQSVGECGGDVQAESVSVGVAVIVCESISESADCEVAERRSGSACSICIASILQH